MSHPLGFVFVLIAALSVWNGLALLCWLREDPLLGITMWFLEGTAAIVFAFLVAFSWAVRG